MDLLLRNQLFQKNTKKETFEKFIKNMYPFQKFWLGNLNLEIWFCSI